MIFDVPADSPHHGPTLSAIGHAADRAGFEVIVNVVKTDTITPAYFDDLPHGVVIGPGTPYTVPDAAEDVIRTAREKGLPLIGT